MGWGRFQALVSQGPPFVEPGAWEARGDTSFLSPSWLFPLGEGRSNFFYMGPDAKFPVDWPEGEERG